jgi:hypothetical protein
MCDDGDWLLNLRRAIVLLAFTVHEVNIVVIERSTSMVCVRKAAT